MRVVMGGESLLGQKTGIGHYTENLASHLQQAKDIDELKFLVHGKLVQPQALLNTVEDPGLHSITNSSVSNLLEKVRGIASQNGAAVWCYEKVMPHIERYALREYTGRDIFHSPNYLLPSFPGKRVVTILDLSTVKYPEFHPPARVSLMNNYINRVVQEADHIITISDFIKNEIIEHFGVVTDKITAIHLAAGEQYAPLTEVEFDNRISAPNLVFKKYFLFASTIEPRKNISRLLDAYSLYREKEGTGALPLIMVGHPGWRSTELHQRINSMDVVDGVRYLGYVEQPQMPVLFGGARALLFPSLYEGFGLPVLEAMQAGSAVLTSGASAMSEVSQNSAVLVDSNDTENIAHEIGVLAMDDQRVRQLELAGLERSSEFSWDQCAKQTLSIYKSLAA